jgi:hypothetical protein
MIGVVKRLSTTPPKVIDAAGCTVSSELNVVEVAQSTGVVIRCQCKLAFEELSSNDCVI